jgi:hypothetical protein
MDHLRRRAEGFIVKARGGKKTSYASTKTHTEVKDVLKDDYRDNVGNVPELGEMTGGRKA